MAIRLHENRHDPGADFPEIQQRGLLKVCGEYDLFSFYTDEKGQHGFHYELVEAFSEQYDLNVTYLYEPNFKTRLKLLKSGKYDIIVGPLPVISELKDQMAYTDPIYTSRLMLVQRKKTEGVSIMPIRNQVYLAKQEIALPIHSPYTSRLHHLAAEISDSINIRKVTVFNAEELIRLVADGHVDFALLDEQVANAYREKFNDIDFNTPVSFTQFQAWAVKKERTLLLDSLNQFLDTYKKSPAFARLRKKYMD
jgi:membrane-bound lytic murein transglycosylase MltF